MDAAIDRVLRQGIAAARAGRRTEARELLTRVITADERSEQGWLWLSGVVDDPADIRTCLQNVLDINPNSAPAKKGMAWVVERYGATPQPPEAPPAHERTVGQDEPPAERHGSNADTTSEQEPPAERRGSNAVTTTTLSLKREGFERAAAQHQASAPPPPPPSNPAPRQPTMRLSEPVFDPLSTSLAARPSAARPPAPTMLMEQVSARPPEVVATPAVASTPPAAAAAPIASPALPVATARPSAPAEHPCPFCGAPTTLKQQRCTQCRQSLMVRATPPARRSAALTILGVIWVIGGIFTIIGAALIGVLLLIQLTAPAQASGAIPSGFLAIVMAALLLFSLICIGLARGLWARNPAFYYLNIALIVVGVVVRVGLLVRGAALFAGLAALASRSSPWAGAITAGATVLPLLLGLLLVLLPLVLTVLCYRDFFGPMQRFTPTVEKAEHAEHYNSGIGYRDRGMWYMAIQEWAMANRLRPGDRTYLQTLGLAYAQIRKLYPNSKAHLSDVEAFLRGRKAELYGAAPELEQLNLL